jgi:hypothetical protein
MVVDQERLIFTIIVSSKQVMTHSKRLPQSAPMSDNEE